MQRKITPLALIISFLFAATAHAASSDTNYKNIQIGQDINRAPIVLNTTKTNSNTLIGNKISYDGNDNIILGNNSQLLNNSGGNVALGNNADIQGSDGVAIGNNAKTNGSSVNGVAIGSSSKAANGSSIAIGDNATGAYNGLAIGNNATANGNAAVYLGIERTVR